MNKYDWWGYVSRDTAPIFGQHKWLCRTYLKQICVPGRKQNLQIRRNYAVQIIKLIRQYSFTGAKVISYVSLISYNLRMGHR